MKLMRVGEKGMERPCVMDSQGVARDVSDIVTDYTPALIGEVQDRLAGVDLANLPAMALEGARIGAPVARPNNVWCIGLNFSDHAAETGMKVPEEPIMFMKPSSAIAGPHDTLVQPAHSHKLDWEIELGVVIGKAGLQISKSAAMDHVLGYTIAIDISEREWQIERGGQWSKGKSYPGFCPLGPAVVTTDDLADPSHLAMELTINDVVKQKGTTATMIFDIPSIVAYLSQFVLLEPGDVICTGTPPGVGMGRDPKEFLQSGDRLRATIEGLGELSFVIARA